MPREMFDLDIIGTIDVDRELPYPTESYKDLCITEIDDIMKGLKGIHAKSTIESLFHWKKEKMKFKILKKNIDYDREKVYNMPFGQKVVIASVRMMYEVASRHMAGETDFAYHNAEFVVSKAGKNSPRCELKR